MGVCVCGGYANWPLVGVDVLVNPPFLLVRIYDFLFIAVG